LRGLLADAALKLFAQAARAAAPAKAVHLFRVARHRHGVQLSLDQFEKSALLDASGALLIHHLRLTCLGLRARFAGRGRGCLRSFDGGFARGLSLRRRCRGRTLLPRRRASQAGHDGLRARGWTVGRWAKRDGWRSGRA
jgi:hypothetical protein